MNLSALWLTDEIQAVTRAFEARHSGVKVEFFRQVGAQIYERYRAEHDASAANTDVLSIEPTFLQQLGDAGALTDYGSADQAKFGGGAHGVVTLFEYVNAIVVNTHVFPDRATWPLDWTSFAAPRPEWIGKLCLGDYRVLAHAYNNLAAIYQKLGEQTWPIYHGLAAAKARIYTGAPQAIAWVSSGQCPLLFQIPIQNYVKAAESGAPVALILPESGLIPTPVAVGIAANPPHPAAARLFYDFLLSKEGQDVFAQLHLRPRRADASVAWWPSGPGLPKVDAVKIMPIDPVRAYDENHVLVSQANEIMRLQ